MVVSEIHILFFAANNLDHNYLHRHSQEGATEAMAGLVRAGKVMITTVVADIGHIDSSCHLDMMIQIYVGDHVLETKASRVRFYFILFKCIRLDMLVIFFWVERLL